MWRVYVTGITKYLCGALLVRGTTSHVNTSTLFLCGRVDSHASVRLCIGATVSVLELVGAGAVDRAKALATPERLFLSRVVRHVAGQ